MSQSSSTNERQIRKAKAQAKRDEEVEKTIVSTLMKTIDGRRWIWLQLAFAQCFVGTENLDAAGMAFEKGRRNSGLKLLASVMKYAPEQFPRMFEENSGVTPAPEEDESETEQN